MKRQIKDLLGQEIFLFSLVDEENIGYSKTFSKQRGVVSELLESAHPSYYDYQIYFPILDNSYLCNGDEIIDVRTREKHPEYFL